MSVGPSAVLVIDDDQVDRERVERLIGRHFRLRCVPDGESGLELLRASAFDCVLLDYRLPGEDGLELLARIVEEFDGAVVMLTGEGSELVATQAMQRGAHGYVTKDHLTEDLLRHVIESAQAKAAQQRKLEAQQEEFRHFAFTAAHDLRAPFRKIRTYCDMLAESLGENYGEKQRTVIDRIDRAVVSLDGLIEGLLQYARMGHNQKASQDVDLAQALDGALFNLQAVIEEKGATVERGKLPVVGGDPTALSLLFQNLVGNAIKFNLNKPHVRVTAERKEVHWLVTVSDNGIGIPAHHLERVFKPFERLHGKDEYDGVGLGLATCRRIVDAHGGTIWAESQLKNGTRILFSLAAG